MMETSAQPTPSEVAAYSIDAFCKAHGISRSYIYLLWKKGQGPSFMQIGDRRLISREAAAAWRASLEQSPAKIAA